MVSEAFDNNNELVIEGRLIKEVNFASNNGVLTGMHARLQKQMSKFDLVAHF